MNVTTDERKEAARVWECRRESAVEWKLCTASPEKAQVEGWQYRIRPAPAPAPLPCPNCGNDAPHMDIYGCVNCRECGVTAPNLATWNRRAPCPTCDWKQRRLDALQAAQKSMRDPERTMVCDILANATLLAEPNGGRYEVKPCPTCAEPCQHCAILHAELHNANARAKAAEKRCAELAWILAKFYSIADDTMRSDAARIYRLRSYADHVRGVTLEGRA